MTTLRVSLQIWFEERLQREKEASRRETGSTQRERLHAERDNEPPPVYWLFRFYFPTHMRGQVLLLLKNKRVVMSGPVPSFGVALLGVHLSRTTLLQWHSGHGVEGNPLMFYKLEQFDPNGRQCLTMQGYRKIGQIIHQQADLCSGGRLLVVQEGGYHITYAAYCLHATLEGVLNLPLPLLSDPVAYYPEDETLAEKAIECIKKYWHGIFPTLNEAK